MGATKSIRDISPEQRKKFLEKKDRLEVYEGGLKSPYFDIYPGIITDKNGDPLYDRPVIREAPNVVVVIWGCDKDGTLRFGMIRQKRPASDDPRLSDVNNPPVTFAQVVMGYLDGESIEEGALREKSEEVGKGKVLNTEILPFPLMNLDPNTYATWKRIAFVKVDLSTIDNEHVNENEFISSVTYQPASDVLRYIMSGWDETGACYREGHTLAALMIFFSVHPDLFPQ